MNVGPKGLPRRYKEGLFSALSVGFFFVLVGAIFVITPGLFDKIIAFFSDFDVVSVPNTKILLPAPASPGKHSVLYSAVTQFCFAWSLYQIAILALRFFVRSPLSKKAETVSNIVFWLGAGYLTNTFLNKTTKAPKWFAFWAALILIIGVSLIVRAVIVAAARQSLHDTRAFS